MTSLQDYKEYTSQLNEITNKINTLITLRSSMVSQAATLLSDVIVDSSLLSLMEWCFSEVDQNYIVFEAIKGGYAFALRELLRTKDTNPYSEYDITRSHDNDHVALSLLVTQHNIKLHIHSEDIFMVLNRYSITNIQIPKLTRAASNLLQKASALSEVILALEELQ